MFYITRWICFIIRPNLDKSLVDGWIKNVWNWDLVFFTIAPLDFDTIGIILNSVKDSLNNGSRPHNSSRFRSTFLWCISCNQTFSYIHNTHTIKIPLEDTPYPLCFFFDNFYNLFIAPIFISILPGIGFARS